MKSNILVVDDTRDNLRLLSNMLNEQGYLTRPVSQGARAIAAAAARPPDLILLDIMMPGMDGYAVCQALKADDRTRDIPIIFISALNETVDKVKGFALGGVDYITKPFQAEEVLARVRIHLDLRTVRRQVEEQNRELRLLNAMSHGLHACRTEQDTYQVVAETCRALFPDSSGCLFRCRGEDDALTVTVTWNSPPRHICGRDLQSLEFMYPDEAQVIEHPDAGPLVSRIGYAPEHNALSIPIGNLDGLLALLLVSFATPPDWAHLLEMKQGILIEIANHYALTLTNVQLRERLRHEAIHDPLTGLYNRRHMEAAFERETHRARRRKTAISVLMFDVDHFKRVNDTYGHEAGDAVLSAIGGLLRDTSRGEDVACRYGGEEFLLILPDTALDEAVTRAEHLLETVRAQAISFQDDTLNVTISIGVAAYPRHGTDLHALASAADAALYEAKEAGRNRVVTAARPEIAASEGAIT